MKQPENHPWQAANDYAFQRRHGPGGDRWRRVRDNELLALYEQAIQSKPITICPPGEHSNINWSDMEDPRYNYVTCKVDPVIREDE